MVELVVRLVFSLAVVLGLLVLVVRVGAKRFRGAPGALVSVVHRQPLSRGSAIAVVTVGSRVLVVGTTEQQVQLLTELDPDELDGLEVGDLAALSAAGESPLTLLARPASIEPVEAAGDSTDATAAARSTARSRAAGGARAAGRARPTSRPRPGRRRAPATDGPLAGSLLSAQTWRQALAAATGRDRAAS